MAVQWVLDPEELRTRSSVALTMPPTDFRKKSACGNAPEFGAIFMSNRSSFFHALQLVSFTVIWNCCPLSEPDFCDAIRENYFTEWKFNIVPSKYQVEGSSAYFTLQWLEFRNL
ncbi:hypothetical protein RHSIM_Rhsim12G0097700 [Rhododendron simsii]|uniref:DCD domain-containing protein n=1 Tax=Rhododendron simsii TaxID=118357 RepID=A0A834G524_RHOSS|nr:hypothetical protein RHSIM_Rhsim12G0097700 [Rhododendron simsii]